MHSDWTTLTQFKLIYNVHLIDSHPFRLFRLSFLFLKIKLIQVDCLAIRSRLPSANSLCEGDKVDVGNLGRVSPFGGGNHPHHLCCYLGRRAVKAYGLCVFERQERIRRMHPRPPVYCVTNHIASVLSLVSTRGGEGRLSRVAYRLQLRQSDDTANASLRRRGP